MINYSNKFVELVNYGKTKIGTIKYGLITI